VKEFASSMTVGRVVPDALAERAIPLVRGGVRIIRPVVLGVLVLFGVIFAHAAEKIPPAPRDHFNDYAGIVHRQTAQELESKLTQFERDTSNQLLVVIYPHMESDSSIEDYTVRVFEAWKVGKKGISNGAVLFIFSQDHRMRIATGYGLESALPDALCKRILDDEIAPRFRQDDFDGGVRAGTLAMMAAARGEYRGNGRLQGSANTVVFRRGGVHAIGGMIFLFLIVASIVVSVVRRLLGGYSVYNRGGRVSPWWGGNNWGGGGWGGGGGWSGGGGSFSGGGGSTGGGGASGSW
jgi:uncharacterized protein